MKFWKDVSVNEKRKSIKKISSETAKLLSEQQQNYTSTNENDVTEEQITNTLKMLNSDDDELNHQVLRSSLGISMHGVRLGASPSEIIENETKRRYSTARSMQLTSIVEHTTSSVSSSPAKMRTSSQINGSEHSDHTHQHIPSVVEKQVLNKIRSMLSVTLIVILGVGVVLAVGSVFVGPPNQPVGKYKLFQAQTGESFWNFYNFYEGPDSAGSNGYVKYISKKDAMELELAKVITEDIPLYGNDTSGNETTTSEETTKQDFIFMGSAPTKEGPRLSIRLEGKQRFDRGLFIIDLDHMPSGCGTWPAFWLTDEVNWPVNGEIDILEGVNYQEDAKTALHATQHCNMFDLPQGVMTGVWDTAVGVPDKKTGKPDMTMREAKDCFVYDSHQWLNQGCVAINDDGGTIGEPFNDKGGGVYVLEWDPINRHIRSWVFTPHGQVPQNLKDALRTANEPDESKRIAPDTTEFGTPFGYFPIGQGTNCASSHFKNMRLVINLAFCGTVSGNRYFMDCPAEHKKYKTCNQFIASEPDLVSSEAYWKIRGVYVYQREWERRWV